MAYDQMLGEGNEEGNAVLQAVIDALLAQTKSIENRRRALNLNSIAFEGSDSWMIQRPCSTNPLLDCPTERSLAAPGPCKAPFQLENDRS